ncbi:hypothetical protein [Anaerovibrio lipolyticus]|jgi:hypothetical protein|uniref:hypothetical protein n=1 Tax=Anaerovibrio lipolyticus TaxID=82374 RepID=UPI0004865C2C|nr:hypothetical protein [Anaerovibrio lipolyticus]
MAQLQDEAKLNSNLYTTRAVHYELLFCFAGKLNFLQKNKKEVTLLSAYGYKGQRVNNNI